MCAWLHSETFLFLIAGFYLRRVHGGGGGILYIAARGCALSARRAQRAGAARVRALRYLRRHASTYVTEEMAAHTLEQLGQLWLSPTPLPRSSSFAGTDILCFAPKKDDDEAVRAAHEQQRSGFEGVKRERTAAEAAA